MSQSTNYAVIDRDGFFRDTTRVHSAHRTQQAAIREAKTHRVNIPGNPPRQSSAMVIGGGEFRKGQTVYRDSIRSVYPVVW